MKLPKTVAEMILVIGEKAAFLMVKAYGGTVMLVPKGLRQSGIDRLEDIARLIGDKEAKAFCHHYGGSYISIPKCQKLIAHHRNREIIKRFDELVLNHSARVSVTQCARAFQLTEASIWSILKLSDTETQTDHNLSLF